MKITDLKPTIVWKFFHQVTQVPRPSKKEGKMIEFLESFAKEYKIAIKKDEAGNLLMSKPATPGMEDRPVVVLQSHMDMVCEKNNGTKHDFDNDPIETIVDGEWLRANGTTLGADNGIGVAAELALLASDDIQHGPIECLFTVDEETGLTGAKALKEGFMTGDILLNLDSEDEGEIFMGCAGGKDTQATFHYEPVPTSDKMQYFRIDVKGLNGGHELKHVDPSVQLAMESTDRPEYHIDNATAEKLIYALHACPHGVIGMSHDIEGLVETSTNLASIKMKEGNTILIGTSQRSSIESCKIAIANTVASTFLLAGADVKHGDGYPGWAPNPDSKILKIAQETYKRLFNKDAKIMAIHAGLECGLFLEKYPKLDMISFGPTLRDVHSPNERIEIATVGLWWSHLLELLKSIPAK